MWCAERPFIWNGIDVGGRMVVIKLQDGGLWVHSPIELDSALEKCLRELGPVKHIVSPNYEHVRYAKQWVEKFPAAISYACPGLRNQKPEVGFTNEIGEGAPAAQWPAELDLVWLDCEVNPATGKPFFNEVNFFHSPTGTLITTDFYWNYPEGDNIPLGTRLWKFGMDRVYLPFYRNFMVRDREAYDGALRKMEKWGIVKIVPCHGLLVTSRAKEALLSHARSGVITRNSGLVFQREGSGQ
jgi:hypothetical protein